jgi:hypothetical protein
MSIPGLPPGVYGLLMKHDAWCPAKRTQRTADCICNPEVELVDEARLVETIVTINREQRRAAERAARRAKK